ncbi:MAG: glycosyltransferase, partial [Actinomycetota bacterium]|nr:glycosyltransferase [Actinomycetota bacterium]
AYHPYDPAFAGLLESGRRDIARMAGKVTLAMAPSAYNAFELVAMGYRDVRLSPLIVDVARLQSIEPDPAVTDALAEVEGPVLLYVGQLLPHKCPERLVQAFHVLSTYLQPEAQLLLVGASRSVPYRRRFDTFVRELNLRGLRVVGSVTDAELAAYFRRADVFVTASSHEGFCVPLVEAMSFGLPVVARACGAVPETLDGAGIILPAEQGPLLFAEAVDRLLGDRVLRDELVSRGEKRLDHFRPDDARTTFLRHLLSVA